MNDDPQPAAAHYRAMDLAFPGRPRDTWEQRTPEEQAEWWVLQKAVDGFTAATFSPDKRPKW